MYNDGWYIINIFAKEYYGPFYTKENVEQNEKIVKQIVDMCVEIGTNVIVVDLYTFINDYRDFKEGFIDVVRQRIDKMKGL